jgi:hypothetical protein
MSTIFDLRNEISRREKAVLKNHFFICVFILFIVAVGSVGIWLDGLLYLDISKLSKNASTINLLSFSLPLLTTLLLDAAMTGRMDASCSAQAWINIAFVFSLLLIALCFGLGGKWGQGNFHWISLFGCFFTLYVWVLANIDNPNYSLPVDGRSASGGANEPQITSLRRG